uniref:Uncharacterized protein n=1 Tax=Nicotiana tabacum TaxID=4097 RepID=A0A1S4ATG5_TOBAC|nr:PREDICTED: uncharacterized protein LOC107801098 [Nicotiana tabacum]
MSPSTKFLDILSQVWANLPLIEVLQEVPKYAKYLRDIMANKRRLIEFEAVSLTEEWSARVHCKLPTKLKDLGYFIIPLKIEKHEVGRALSDLGESINLMPLSIFKQLEFGEPRPTIITLQLDSNYFGRPFLAIGGALIDVREGKLKMIVHDEEDTFNVHKVLNLPKHYEDLCMISVIESKAIDPRIDVSVDAITKRSEPEKLQLVENVKLCKGKTKKLHDKNLAHCEFKPGQSVLVHKSRLKIFPRKLQPRWCGPFEIVCAIRHGDVELRDPMHGDMVFVKEQRVQPY